MGFESKKALLQHLGKNEKDNKLVDRLILRGEVYMEDGMYYIVDKDAIIEDLRRRVSELEGKITTFNDENGDLEFYKVNCEYWEDLNNKKKEIINNILNDIYLDSKKKGSMENTDDFFTRMSEKYGYNPKED